MAAMSEQIILDRQRYEFIPPINGTSPHDELAQARKEIELLKAANPFHAVDMAIEIQVERMRLAEVMTARDALVQRLSDAYELLRQRSSITERLQKEHEDMRCDSTSRTPTSTAEQIQISQLKEELLRLDGIIKALREEVKFLKDIPPNVIKSTDPPPRYEEGASSSKDDTEHIRPGPGLHPLTADFSRSSLGMSSPANSSLPISRSTTVQDNDPSSAHGETSRVVEALTQSNGPADWIKARNAILADLPIPDDVPDDTLSPIKIPAPFTLQEFLTNASGPPRNSLGNYRLLYASTTLWCPEREEHGFFYAPVFKCSTNPRVTTAHRWNSVDVIGRMNRPTECFFNKDGTWYYAGIYKAFRLDDLTAKEWAELPPETTQAIVKDTISGRKNTSPQNIYETSQLYAAGALKVACIGLQCVGFNHVMYNALLEQANNFAQTKWKGNTMTGGFSPGGVGTVSDWNSTPGSASDLAEGLGAMALGRRNADRNETMPTEGVNRAKR